MKLDIDYKAIGLRIKAARIRKGFTQGNIAQLTGLSTPHISNIETGNTKLGLPTIIHLANVLDVSVDELHIISELAKVIKKAGINSAKKVRKRRTKAEMAAARAAQEAAKEGEA